VHRDRERISTDRLGLRARRDEDSLELVLAGDLDMTAAFKVEPEFDRLVAEQDVRRLVVDVGDVEFIDSAGLGALLSIRDRTRQLGIEMSLVNVPRPVRRILDLSGTSVLLPD
jgi:anti-anti-sigma factor